MSFIDDLFSKRDNKDSSDIELDTEVNGNVSNENNIENENVEEKVQNNMDSDDLATFREYQREIQQSIADSMEVSPSDIEKAKGRLSSTLNGNSYLATTYEKEYASLKNFEYVKRYQELIDKLKTISTMSDIESLKKQSDSLRDEMYEQYALAKKGAIMEFHQNEEATRITSTRRQLALDLEKASYLAETYQKKYECFEKYDYVSQFQNLTNKVQEATTLEQLYDLKRVINDLKDDMRHKSECAPSEDLYLRRKRALPQIYQQLLAEDVSLVCQWLGYDRDSKFAMEFQSNGEQSYQEMLNASDDEISQLYSQRDQQLKDLLARAFFLKCLKIDVKLHKLSKAERVTKYKNYLRGTFNYPEKFQKKIREKLSAKYINNDIALPIWLQTGDEFENNFRDAYSLANRVNKALERVQ